MHISCQHGLKIEFFKILVENCGASVEIEDIEG
jgi:hypothetical protein